MTSEISMPQKGAILALLSLSTGLAGWLYFSAGDTGVAGCVAGTDCGEVLRSGYARIAGVPSALVGLLVYVGLAAACLFEAGRAVRPLALAAVAGALWFVGIQAFVLKAWCPLCCAAHLWAVAAAALALRLFPAPEGRGRFSARPWLGHTLAVLAMTGALGLLRLAAPSSAAPSSRFQAVDTPAAGAAAAAAPVAVTEKGEVSLFGKVTVDPRGTPGMTGGGGLFMSPSQIILDPLNGLLAPRPVVLLSDWTCAHCRALHTRLAEWKKGAGGADKELTTLMESTGLLFLPAWREEAGRELHRVILTAWLTDVTRYETLTGELLTGALAAEPAAVSARAKVLFGEKWDAVSAAAAGTVAALLETGAAALRESDSRLEVAGLPQMIGAAGIQTGEPTSVEMTAFLRGDQQTSNRLLESERLLATPNKSRIRFDAAALTVEAARPGAEVRAEFHFTNDGTEPLHVVSVRTGCSCTAVDNWKQTVAPGARGSVAVRIDTAGFRDGVVKQINLVTNAGNSGPGGLLPLRVTTVFPAPPGPEAVTAPSPGAPSADVPPADNRPG